MYAYIESGFPTGCFVCEHNALHYMLECLAWLGRSAHSSRAPRRSRGTQHNMQGSLAETMCAMSQ